MQESSSLILWQVHSPGCLGLEPENVTASLPSQFSKQLWHPSQTPLAHLLCSHSQWPGDGPYYLMPAWSMAMTSRLVSLHLCCASKGCYENYLSQNPIYRMIPLCLKPLHGFSFHSMDDDTLQHSIKDLYELFSACLALPSNSFRSHPIYTPLRTHTWIPLPLLISLMPFSKYYGTLKMPSSRANISKKSFPDVHLWQPSPFLILLKKKKTLHQLLPLGRLAL